MALPWVAQAQKPVRVKRLTKRAVRVSHPVPFQAPGAEALLPLQFSLQSGQCAGSWYQPEREGLVGTRLGIGWSRSGDRSGKVSHEVLSRRKMHNPVSRHTAPVC